MEKVYIAVGSNKGNRKDYIIGALKHVRKRVSVTRISPFISSRPAEGVKGGLFLNGVFEGMTKLSPQKLFEFLQHVEAEAGRNFPHPRGGAREIDLDIIFYGERVIASKKLVIPHPGYRKRDFVLTPLCEVAPYLKDPVTGERMIDLKKKWRKA